MRKTLWIGALVLAGMVAQAATNDLTTTLQRGLFEEEANRNLEAAIKAYQSVANQFDKDRKLAATAIFRLGECYRKQGDTNQAAVQFERIVREFFDQSALATLSRQNLAGLGVAATTAAGSQTAVFKNKVSELTNTEAEEVKRIQALIKDSPDLINASDAQTSLTPLHKAAEAGQLVVAQFLLANGADTEAKDRLGRTPLHRAAAAGHKAMVELLLSKQANVKATDEKGLTPLHLAAENGYRSVAESLLAQGAPVDAKDKSSSTPLLLAAAHGFKSVMELLLAHKADINAATDYIKRPQANPLCGTALSLAAQRGDQALAEFLLAKGAAVNAANNQGQTALSYAVQDGNEPLLKSLLAAHADPNAGTKYLPLAVAAYCGNTNTLQRLLAAGADPNAKSQVSWSITTRNVAMPDGGSLSPLSLAVNQHHPEAVTALLRGKADPEALGPQDYPVLFDALADAPTLKALLEGGANANLRDPQGVTPLQAAMELNTGRREAAVALLLTHHAQPNAAVGNGWTPLHAAAQLGDTNAMGLLLQHGADPNAKTVDGGYTPLRVAAMEHHAAALTVLLEHHADPNARDNGGQTVLDYAKSQSPQFAGIPGSPTSLSLMMTRPTPLPALGRPNPPSPGPGSPASLADLLRAHGALDDLPRLDAIELRRPATHYSQKVFTRSTNAANQFTLAEAVGVEYALLAGSVSRDFQRESYQALAQNQFGAVLSYPDLAHVRVRKPAPDLKSWQERTLDLTPLLEHGVCSNNVVLDWGEVVEIPEQDHPLDKNWEGFTQAQMENLLKCLKRQVKIVIKDQATKVTLGPELVTPQFPLLRPNRGQFEGGATVKKGTLWLRPALLGSGLVLASSDLSRVKLIRQDKATGKKHEWVVDCTVADPAPDFWLQDGDVIEVPEKGQGYGAAEVPAKR